MKPNFEEMSRAELRAYVLAHREDNEAFRVLMDRRTLASESTWYPSMCTKDGVPIAENIRIAEEALRQRVEQENQRKKDSQS